MTELKYNCPNCGEPRRVSCVVEAIVEKRLVVKRAHTETFSDDVTELDDFLYECSECGKVLPVTGGDDDLIAYLKSQQTPDAYIIPNSDIFELSDDARKIIASHFDNPKNIKSVYNMSAKDIDALEPDLIKAMLGGINIVFTEISLPSVMLLSSLSAVYGSERAIYPSSNVGQVFLLGYLDGKIALL